LVGAGTGWTIYPPLSDSPYQGAAVALTMLSHWGCCSIGIHFFLYPS